MLSPYPKGWGRMAPPSPGCALDGSHPLARGLVMCLIPQQGIKWYDAAGVNHGTLNNNVRWSAPSPLGGPALAFDGSTDFYVDVGADVSLNVGNVFTFSCWVRLAAVNAAYVVYGPNAASGNGFMFQCGQITSGQNGRFGALTGGNVKIYTSAAGILSANTWYHLLYSRNGTGSGNGKLYLNGRKLTGSEIVDDSATNFADVSAHVIGYQTAGTKNLNGDLADVRLWSRALSDAEVLSLFLEPYALFQTLPGWWSRIGELLLIGDATVQGVGDTSSDSVRVLSGGASVQTVGDISGSSVAVRTATASVQTVGNLSGSSVGIRSGVASVQGVGQVAGAGFLAGESQLNVTSVTVHGDSVTRSGQGDSTTKSGSGDGIARGGGKA